MNIEIRKHISKLGLKAEDKVTGLEGVVASVSFDLYGCVQVVLTPKAKDNKKRDSLWLDISRIRILDKTPVMKRPNYECGSIARGEHGCTSKNNCNKSF